MASLMIVYIMVGEQITAEQLIEKCIIMRISRHDHEHRLHIIEKRIIMVGEQITAEHLLLLLHTSTAIQHASRVLSP